MCTPGEDGDGEEPILGHVSGLPCIRTRLRPPIRSSAIRGGWVLGLSMLGGTPPFPFQWRYPEECIQHHNHGHSDMAVTFGRMQGWLFVGSLWSQTECGSFFLHCGQDHTTALRARVVSALDKTSVIIVNTHHILRLVPRNAHWVSPNN